MAQLQPCTAWIKELLLTLIFIVSTSCGACRSVTVLCTSTWPLLCKVSSMSFPGRGLLHTLHIDVQFFVPPLFLSAILNRTLASFHSFLHGFDVRTYCLSILCKVEGYSSFYLPAIRLAPCALVERCCQWSFLLNETGKKDELKTLLTVCL